MSFGSQHNYLRTLLVLARASNLPTVWSNCLAGFYLGGGGSFGTFVTLALAATALYSGGMYLNDAFDAEFDRAHRKERPIPSGAISVGEVWAFGLGWILIGSVLLGFFGSTTFLLGLCLIFSILLYDAVHKAVAFSPILMAACRFFLFLIAASTGEAGVSGLALWSALALALYIIGLTYVAKGESVRTTLKYWPCICMAGPVLLAWLVNAAEYKVRALIISILFIGWVLHLLRYTFWTDNKNVGRTVSGLLAGIVIVDFLALAGGPPDSLLPWVFLMLFGTALLFQRFIPAT